MSGGPDERQGKRVAARAISAVVLFSAAALFILFVPSGDRYLWIKALHIIAVMSWMAGMLYLPRLFIYHTGAEPGSVQSETFKLMERRLLRLIMTPAMIISWCLGLYLAWTVYGFQGGWLHAKLLFVLLLSGAHGYFASAVRAFSEDRNTRNARHWRLMNEVPTILMIIVVVIAVVKPF